MNLGEIRDAVRTQMDFDEEDLPNTTLDVFIREAFERTIALEQRWPFYETSWDVVVATTGYGTWPDAESFATIRNDTLGPLTWVEHDDAESEFTTPGTPAYFSLWGTRLYLWPVPTTETTVTVRGWRRPTDWIASGAGTEVDADERLHLPLVHYACSRAYAQQEDETLTAQYEQSWARGVDTARRAIMHPRHRTPLILHGKIGRLVRLRPSFSWSS